MWAAWRAHSNASKGQERHARLDSMALSKGLPPPSDSPAFSYQRAVVEGQAEL